MIPHTGQQLVLDSRDRYRVVSTSRRWGKDALCRFCIEISDAREILFVGPNHGMNKFFKTTMVVSSGRKIVYMEKNEDKYRGHQFDLVIINEPATMTPYLLDELLPCLIPDGKLLAVGTPVPSHKHQTDLFIELKKFAQSKKHFLDAAFFMFPIKTNPFLNAEDLRSVVESSSEVGFRADMLGEFVELTGDDPPVMESPYRIS